MVESALPEDVNRIAPLFDAYRQFYGAESDLPAAHSFLSQRLTHGESVVLLASLVPHPEDYSVVAGFAQLYPSFSSLGLGRSLVLNDLYVAPAWRRLGIARCLVNEVLAYARRAGALRIELATQCTNQSALRLYEVLGFVRDTEFVHLGLEVG